MLELSDFKNRRNLDTLFFLPIDRRKLAAVHFISGFIQVVVIYTVAFLSSLVYLLINTDCFELAYMIPYYFLSVLVGFVIYSFFSFIFNQGNTETDGIILCILWAFVAYAVMAVTRETVIKAFWGPDTWYVEHIQRWNEGNSFASWGIVYAPINNLTVIFEDLIEVNRHGAQYVYEQMYAYRYIQQMYMFFVWGAVGIACAVGFVIGFGRKGAHLAGEPSDSWLAYKSIIPIYGYSLALYSMTENSFEILLILTVILMLIGYVVYRRSFKIKKSDIIAIACILIPILIGLLLKSMMPTYVYV